MCPLRFGDLKRLVSESSEKMLIQQLRGMEADGLVHREVSSRGEYSATPLSQSLDGALGPLAEGGKQHGAAIEVRKAKVA